MDKLNNIKAMFVDIDGTLTDSNKTVPEENRAAIKAAVDKGIFVIICSGRGNQYVELRSKLANASDYIISSNGAQIYNYATKETLFGNEMNVQALEKVTNFVEERKCGYIINCSDIRYSNKYLYRKMDPQDGLIDKISEVVKPIYQLVVEADSYELIDEIVNYVKTVDELEILNYTPGYLKGDRTLDHYYLDINSKGIDKGVAIGEFLKLFKIKKEEALCFGDHVNDEPMFDACGIGVAMGNANDRLKARAKYVTKTNDENGVAYFINNYVL